MQFCHTNATLQDALCILNNSVHYAVILLGTCTASPIQ